MDAGDFANASVKMGTRLASLIEAYWMRIARLCAWFGPSAV
jgi:hypothetical protein